MCIRDSFKGVSQLKFRIKHEIKGRMRVHMAQKRMSYEQADTLLYYLQTIPGVESANVYDRTADAAIRYLSLIHI